MVLREKVIRLLILKLFNEQLSKLITYQYE